MASKKSEVEKVETKIGADRAGKTTGDNDRNRGTKDKGERSDSDGPPDNVPV